MYEFGFRPGLPPYAYVPTPDELFERQTAIAQHIEQQLPTFWHGKDPRDYQRETVERFAEIYMQRAEQGDPPPQAACIQFPGAGKTIEAAFIASLMGVGKQLVPSRPPICGLYVAPNVHILQQAVGQETSDAKGFQLVAPDITTHLYTGSRPANPHSSMWMITSAMLVSRFMRSDTRQPFWYTDFLFADEADLMVGTRAQAALNVLQHNGAASVGASATNYFVKKDHKALTIYDVWPDSIDDRSLAQGIEDRYLRPAIVYGVDLDVASVTEIAELDEMQQASAYHTFMEETIESFALRSAETLASFGLKTIIFTQRGNQSERARNLAAHLRQLPIFDRKQGDTGSLHAEAIGEFRKDNIEVIRQVENGSTQYITSVKMGERGTDITHLRGLVLTSRSTSAARVTQQIGRVVRISEAERLSDAPLAPAVIIFLHYRIAPKVIHSSQQVTPYDVLDLPHKPGAIAQSNYQRERDFGVPADLPQALASSLRDLYASESGLYFRQRSRYFIGRLMTAHENDLAEVAAWTHSDPVILRRVLRTNGYPIRQVKHRGKRVELCSDNALLFLDHVMAQPGEKHIGQIVRDTKAPRDTIIRRVRKLGLADYGRPAYSRTGPISSFAPRPDHFQAPQVAAIEAAAATYTEAQFDEYRDVVFIELAEQLGHTKARLQTYCVLAGHTPYARIRGGSKTDCLSAKTADTIAAALPKLPRLHETGAIVSHRSYLTRIANRGIRKTTEELAQTLALHSVQAPIYRHQGTFVYGLDRGLVGFLDATFAVPPETSTSRKDQTQHVATAPRPRQETPALPHTSSLAHETDTPEGASEIHRFYQPHDLRQDDQLKGTRLRAFARNNQILIEHALALLSHHPNVTHDNIALNKDGDIIIDNHVHTILSALADARQLPKVPFGWRSLDQFAEIESVAIEKLIAMLTKANWAAQQVRACQITPSVRIYFASPTVIARLEDMFERIRSHRRA